MIDFKALRFDENHHLGLGDIRLTIGQQEEIEAEIERLRAALLVMCAEVDIYNLDCADQVQAALSSEKGDAE